VGIRQHSVPEALDAITNDFGATFEFGEIFDDIRRGLQPLQAMLAICFADVYVASALAHLMVGHATGQTCCE
jgi:hypothetical protein